MRAPLSVLVYEKAAYAVPQTSGRADSLGGRLDSYEHTIRDGVGFEGMRCGFGATVTEALDWLRPDSLMRACEVFGPNGDRVWEGALVEVEVRLGRLTLRLALKDMANRLLVRYNTPGGDHSPTTVYENLASQYMFGRKDRLETLSGVSDTGADNRAQTALGMIAFPRSTTASESGTGSGGDIAVTLRFEGWYVVLGWILTTSTSETITNNATQLATLLALCNGINAFLSSDTSGIAATLPSDTEWIEPDTPVRDKMEKLLAQGNSSRQPLAWGVYDERRFVVETSAAASPETIHYYEHSRTGEIRDADGNLVAPWLVRPNRMAQVIDVIDVPAPPGAIDSATRKLVARVSLRVNSSGISVTLDPAEDPSIDKILAAPLGAATSDAAAAVERAVTSAARPRFESTENPSRYDGGVWQPGAGGTGVPNTGTIDTGGGNISNTGGGDVDLGTGAGIGGTGSSSVTTSGGVVGRLAVWSTTNALIASSVAKTGAGVVTIDAGADVGLDLDGSLGQVLQHNGSGWVAATLAAAAITDINETIDDRVAALLVAGTGIALTYNDAGNTLTISSDILPSEITGFNEAVDDRVAALLVAGSNITLTYNDASNTLTIAASVPVDGAGVAGRIAQWSDSNSLTYSDALRIDNANVRLGIGATPNRTLEVNGDCIIGGGLVSASLTTGLTAASGQIRASDTIRADNGFQAGGNPVWVMGGYTAGSDAAIIGYVSVTVGGTVRKLAVIA